MKKLIKFILQILLISFCIYTVIFLSYLLSGQSPIFWKFDSSETIKTILFMGFVFSVSINIAKNNA